MSGQRESKQVYLSFIKDFPSSSRRDIELGIYKGVPLNIYLFIAYLFL